MPGIGNQTGMDRDGQDARGSMRSGACRTTRQPMLSLFRAVSLSVRSQRSVERPTEERT